MKIDKFCLTATMPDSVVIPEDVKVIDISYNKITKFTEFYEQNPVFITTINSAYKENLTSIISTSN